MSEILKPLPFEDLPTEPPILGRPKLSDDFLQTMALLCGWDGSTRRLIRVSSSGVLSIGEPAIKDIVHLQGSGTPSVIQGSDIPCSECMVLAHPDNTDIAWVRPYVAVATDYGWPLQSYDMVRFAVSNVNQLFFLFDTAAEKVIIAYTR